MVLIGDFAHCREGLDKITGTDYVEYVAVFKAFSSQTEECEQSLKKAEQWLTPEKHQRINLSLQLNQVILRTAHTHTSKRKKNTHAVQRNRMKDGHAHRSHTVHRKTHTNRLGDKR